MICLNCKQEIAENTGFCEYCGTKLDVEKEEICDTNPQVPSKQEKYNNVIEKRISKWKEKLIDLSKRNRLLNFKHTKSSTLRIIDEQPPEIYRFLVHNLKTMSFLPININEESLPEEEKLSLEDLNEGIEFKSQEFEEYEIDDLDKKHVDNFLQTKLPEKEMNHVLSKISTTAKSTMDDLGYNVLFLTLGSIIWYESEDSEEKYESPLLLIPIEIKRKSINDPFIINYNEDDVILNPALILKFKRDFGINLEEINLDEDELDPRSIFTQVQHKIKNKKRWKLLNNIYIGLFSFAKFVMYKDLDTYKEYIKNSSLVKTICGHNQDQITCLDEICPVEDLDEKIKPQETYQILDADSSQQRAISVVKQNHNLVIEGPPGTGKSQTIANIIAELLSQRKKVLFVSQKIAALDVVKSRLEQNGLAPFCMELHSNKTNKKRVLQELINTLDYTSYSGNTVANLEVLQKNKKDLNDYVKEISKPMGNLDISPYRAISKVVNCSNIPDLEYIFDGYETWDYSKLMNNKLLFTNLKSVLNRLGNPKDYSWYGSEVIDLDYQTKIKLKESFTNVINLIENLEENLTVLSEEIFLEKPKRDSDLDYFLEVATAISKIPKTAFKKFELDDEKVVNDIKLICNCVKEFNSYNKRVKNKYNLGILDEDIDGLIDKFTYYNTKFTSKISINYYKDCKYIRNYFINKHNPNLSQLITELDNIKELKTWIKKIEECDSIASSLFDSNWDKNNPNENDINNSSSNLIKFKEYLSLKIFVGDVISKFNSNGINYNKINKSIENIVTYRQELKQLIDEIKDITKLNFEICFSSDYENIEFTLVFNKINKMKPDVDDLTIWFQYLNAIEEIKKANLFIFYEKCLNIHLPYEDLDTALEIQFLRLWINGFAFSKSNILRQFNKGQHGDLIKQFRILDKDQINSAKLRLFDILISNTSNIKAGYPKEVSALLREGKLQRLRKSLRQIIQMLPNLFLELKPCLMMSPTTVAQLLNPEIFHFDVIIFDEASQLTTEDCIGSIIRGNRLIVAGDTKQLPPTSFFRTVTEPSEEEIHDDDVEDTREDLDSILDECTTSGFPQCMLKWHYRSKHEHLIAFSNKHLYKELYTFPNCVENSDTLGVKFYYHENTTLTKENARLQEAQLVAKAVLNHAKKFPHLSLGVATLNINQKGLIENEIEKLRQEDNSCEDFFSDSKQEYFFVKNLESIQGDERDVIMISVGFFKNQNGVLSMNFGPINQDGGERRLNVLITRARYKLEIFSAIKSIDFNMDKTDKRGVELLQKYLDFAEKGEISLIQNTTTEIDDSFDSEFEESVCRVLRENGLSVKSQVGCSGYKIDLAIRDKNNPGQFILGIECDGAAYHSSATARDRDRLRQEVLENLGWKIYRIWSTDWFKNPQKETQDLLAHIKKLEVKSELLIEAK